MAAIVVALVFTLLLVAAVAVVIYGLVKAYETKTDAELEREEMEHERQMMMEEKLYSVDSELERELDEKESEDDKL